MTLSIVQIVVSLALIALILLQERSSGVGGILGGNEGGFYQRRRGLERMIFSATIVLGIVFAVLSVFHLLV